MHHKPFKSFFASRGQIDTSVNTARAGTAVAAPPRIARVVLGYEKRASDRVVTTVAEIPAELCAAELSELRAKLGTGGTQDGEKLVLQGDHRSKLTAHYEARGVRVAGERG
ncbi:MAG: hypothetical protein EPO68_03930 [Planctomycetota bacterium]|nr:MAG: hypothetical protein EPO68_03930 [Planctomycetota bacterium]